MKRLKSIALYIITPLNILVCVYCYVQYNVFEKAEHYQYAALNFAGRNKIMVKKHKVLQMRYKDCLREYIEYMKQNQLDND